MTQEKERGYAFVGKVGLGTAVMNEFDRQQANLYPSKEMKQAMQDAMKDYIEINGIKYEERPKESSPRLGGKMHSILMAASVMGAMADFPYGGSNYQRKRPNVNIVKEFELIQNKKSLLSKNDRDWVEAVFNLQFKKLEIQ